MSSLHAHEVVGRGSETQLQVGEYFIFIFNLALQGLTTTVTSDNKY